MNVDDYKGFTREQLVEMLKDDKLYLDADQCLKFGICDEIV